MVKKQRIFWLEDEDFKLLIRKALENGFTGKGRIERLIEKICREPIIFLPKNTKLEITFKKL